MSAWHDVGPTTGSDVVLEVDSVSVDIVGRESSLHVVDAVSFALERGRTLGIVGESGSGKSMTARAVMGLLPRPMAKLVGGDVRLRGRSIARLSQSRLSDVRGNDIAMVFQDPLSSLNPVMRVGDQIAESLRRHRRCSRRRARQEAISLMERVGIPAAATRADAYPHQFSGGMRQRVMIAMAIALEPAVLIADEPTTALDVTVQSQILDLLVSMQRELGMSLLLITHNLAVVAQVADTVAVMYAGRLVESGPVRDVFDHPEHPYTRGLLDSMPRLDRSPADLDPMPGRPPVLGATPQGCAFHPRCRYSQDVCTIDVPALVQIGAGNSACHFAGRLEDPHG